MRLCPKPIPASWVEPVGSDRDRLIVYDLNGNTASMTVLAFLATCSITPDTELLTGRVGHDGVEETRQDERRRPPANRIGRSPALTPVSTSSTSQNDGTSAAAVIEQAAAAAATWLTELRQGQHPGAAHVDPRGLEQLQSALGGALPDVGLPARQVIDDLTVHAPAGLCLLYTSPSPRDRS